MNLRAVVAGPTSAINPDSPANLYFSLGQGPTGADGTRPPLYSDPDFISAQVQPISTGDLRKLDALNLQPTNEKIYITGQLNGLNRLFKLGGDLVVLPNGATYLVKAVLEGWVSAGWCSVAVVQQNDNIVPYIQRPRF